LTEGTLKAQRLVKGLLDGLSTPFAELTVDPVPVHGAMEGASVVQGLRVQDQKAGLLGMGNGCLGLVPNHFQDVPYIEG